MDFTPLLSAADPPSPDCQAIKWRVMAINSHPMQIASPWILILSHYKIPRFIKATEQLRLNNKIKRQLTTSKNDTRTNEIVSCHRQNTSPEVRRKLSPICVIIKDKQIIITASAYGCSTQQINRRKEVISLCRVI